MASSSRGIFGSFMSLLSFGDKSYLTLDLGSSSVKMLEVKGRGKSLRVSKAGILPIAGNAVQGNIVHVERLEGQVETICKQNQEVERLEQQKREVEKKLMVV